MDDLIARAVSEYLYRRGIPALGVDVRDAAVARGPASIREVVVTCEWPRDAIRARAALPRTLLGYRVRVRTEEG